MIITNSSVYYKFMAWEGFIVSDDENDYGDNVKFIIRIYTQYPCNEDSIDRRIDI